MHSRIAIFATSAALFTLLAPASALAQRSSSHSTARVDSHEHGYAYTFRDDPLYAGGNAATSARIRVRSRSVRQMLLRPRLHFVPEMLKSVENL